MILPPQYATIRWTEEKAQPWVHESFTWTDRPSYLAWVGEWKITLATAIKAVRDNKAIMHNAANTAADRSAAQSNRHYLRIECANLFLLRAMAKQVSRRQKQKRLAMT